MGKNRLKLLAASAGGAALLVFGVAGVLAEGTASAHGAKMNMGSTSTETTPPTAPGVPMAVPAIKGPAPLPSEEEAAK